MSDLISRSQLLKHCHRVTEYDEAGFSMEYNAVSVEDIKNAPTAYDVDKVVKELESRAEDNEYVSEILKGIESKRQLKLWLERASAFRKAIEIVKGGGVNERD